MQASVQTGELGWIGGLYSASAVFYGRLKRGIRNLTRPSGIPFHNIATTIQSLQRNGYAVMPGYFTAVQCVLARAEIDRIIREQPEALQRDKANADCRVFGAERTSEIIAQFHRDEFCRKVGEAYRQGPLANFSTLAARLTATPGNLGSGQGWHRDAFHFQYKSMVYLSNVGIDNGPFEILPGSHRTFDVVRDTFVGRLDRPPASRISSRQIERLLSANPRRALPLPAAAGTLILFDSSTIHRGMPINTGVRYALTNYYFAPESITPDLTRAFEPFAKA